MDVCARVIAANRAQDRRHQDLAARCAKGDCAARAAAGRRAHVHRRRFQFRRADRRRRGGHSDALLGIFDAIAPAASAALSALAAGDRARFDAILAPTVPLSRHIFAAPTRFYKTGVVFMAWLNGHQSHFTMVGGQQSARSIVHLAELFRLADAGGAAARSRTRGRADAHAARDCTASTLTACVPAPRSRRCCRSIRPPCARSGRCPRSSRACAARHPRHLAVARPGGGRPGSTTRARRIRDAGLTVTGLCRGGMFPAPDREGRRAAHDDNRRAVDEALDARRAMPGARRRRPAEGPRRRRSSRATCAGAREMVRDGLGELHEYAHGAGMPLAIEPLHPMYAADRACVNTLAQANALCDELRPRRRGSASPSTSITCGGIRCCRPRSCAPASTTACYAYHICDWLVPTRDLLNDRGMMGDGVIDLPTDPRVDGSGRLSRHARSRDLFVAGLVEARRRRGVADMPAATRRTHMRARCAFPRTGSPVR